MTTLSLGVSTTRQSTIPAGLLALTIILTVASIGQIAYDLAWVNAAVHVAHAGRAMVLVVYVAAGLYLLTVALRAIGLWGETQPAAFGAHLHASFLIGGGASVITMVLASASTPSVGWAKQALLISAILLQMGLILFTIFYLQSKTVKAALGESFGSMVGDQLLCALARDGAVAILLMLASLIVVLAMSAMPSIKAFGWKFLVSSEWRPNELQVPRRDQNGDPVVEDGEQVVDTVPPAFGALPVIYGTAVSSVISLLFAVPISLGAALFLVRIAPRIRLPRALSESPLGNPSWIVNGVSFLIEFLAAIPSIAYGIWGLFVLAPFLQEHVEPLSKLLYEHLPPASWIGFFWDLVVLALGLLAILIASRRAVGRSIGGAVLAVAIPLIFLIAGLLLEGYAAREIQRLGPGLEKHLVNAFGGSPNLRWLFEEKIKVGTDVITRSLPLTGRDMFCGGLVLAIMILPIITAISRDVLKSVPRAQVEGTVALGSTWWQSSWEMLRYSRSGLFGAVMLGLARAAGETMAITMVIGNNNQIRASLFAPAQTMSSLLANEFHEASTEMHRAALTEVALVLLLMSLLFNVVARYLVVGRNSRSAAAG